VHNTGSSDTAARIIPLPSRRATTRLAREAAEACSASALVLLHGGLGVGKTFFARALLRALGLPRNERVASPTFGLVHEYPIGSRTVLHADLYRLRDVAGPERQVQGLGLAERRAEGAVLIVEWAAGLEHLLGGPPFCSYAFTLRDQGGREQGGREQGREVHIARAL
jgi:tRNA threonylcarbamoyladenosine biosynthesis protein TsaE